MNLMVRNIYQLETINPKILNLKLALREFVFRTKKAFSLKPINHQRHNMIGSFRPARELSYRGVRSGRLQTVLVCKLRVSVGTR